MKGLLGIGGLILYFLCPFSAAAQTLLRARITTPDAPAVSEMLARQGFDILEGSVAATTFEVVASPEGLDQLRQEGFSPEILEVGHPFQPAPDSGMLAPLAVTGYPNLAAIQAALNAAAAAHPSLCQVVDLTARYNTPVTSQGRHLFAVKISRNVAADEDEPSILIVANHHAREITTPVIALYILDRLTDGYGADPAITALLDTYEIWIAPVWNPDGYVYVFDVNNLWRKNRQPYSGGVGVDLNRNYPFGWDSPCDGSSTVSSETYRGPTPASEAETKTMLAWAADRRFAKTADLHSYGRDVRYGYGCWNHPFQDFFYDQAVNLAAQSSGYNAVPSCCTAGDIHNQLANYGAAAFLWETQTAFQPTYAAAQAEAALVWPSLLALLQQPLPLSGHVWDARSGRPVPATKNLLGVNFEHGETNSSESRFGRFQAYLPPGTYTLEFSAPDYFTQTQLVAITPAAAQTLGVPLHPTHPPGDADRDFDVDLVDLSRLCQRWDNLGCAPANQWCQGADADFDGRVTITDLLLMAAFWLTLP